MRKYSVLLLVLVLTTASLLAAAAYNTATVVNAADIKVVNTSQALLGISALGGVGNKDKTAEEVNGVMYVQFGRGINPFFSGDAMYGLQRNSTYEWTTMLAIANKSAEKLQLACEVKYIPAGVTVEHIWTQNGWKTEYMGAANPSYCFTTTGSGSTHWLGFKVTVDSTASLNLLSQMQIVISAVAVP